MRDGNVKGSTLSQQIAICKLFMLRQPYPLGGVVYYMDIIDIFNHEDTKARRHEVFLFSVLRDFVVKNQIPACAGKT